ncbi:MAG: sulfotransferase [Cyanobacteria bacterium J06636_16]
MLPNLVIIGAMKCGTTSLHYYLGLHPEISMSQQKELNFFIGKKKWTKGLDWYKSHFQEKTKILGEASPNYTSFTQFPGVPQRMHSIIPQAKLIYLVRDPIERMIAHYVHQYSHGSENRNIEEALTESNNNFYLDRSLYYLQISCFLDYFDSQNVLIMSAESLRQDTLNSLKKIFEFLDIEVGFESQQFRYQRHKSVRKRRKTALGESIANLPAMQNLKKIPQRLRWPIEELVYFPVSKPIARPDLSESMRHHLKEKLRDDVEKFKRIAKCDFSSWNI